ncbi:GlcG/HbpS family heme-binding protein [Halococcus agarilyticus]|uniref:GlcG/HbpS family heme-binding protein n=1 Tax=Halococcus agarilyticus TaxID=1232219 RepID=UPI0006782A98|nr:heme-binding protein [Halococcus agarilyticus]
MVEAIPLDMAKELADAAEQRAEEIDNPMVIAVANAEGTLIVNRRMDTAWLGSIDIARNKAYTAACYELATDTLGEMAQPGESLYGIQNTNDDRMVIFGGGYPLHDDDELVGAIGVSGGAVEQDMDVAGSAVDRFDELS